MRELSTAASEQDAWEYARQQNIIDTVDAMPWPAQHTAETQLAFDTARKSKNEAKAKQNYIYQLYRKSVVTTDQIEASDEAWRIANPYPAPVPAPVVDEQ